MPALAPVVKPIAPFAGVDVEVAVVEVKVPEVGEAPGRVDVLGVELAVTVLVVEGLTALLFTSEFSGSNKKRMRCNAAAYSRSSK